MVEYTRHNTSILRSYQTQKEKSKLAVRDELSGWWIFFRKYYFAFLFKTMEKGKFVVVIWLGLWI